jgi:hypothetical protein
VRLQDLPVGLCVLIDNGLKGREKRAAVLRVSVKAPAS